MRFIRKSDQSRGRVRAWQLALATALVAALAIPAMAIGRADKVKTTTFPLFVNGANLNCLKAPGRTPTMTNLALRCGAPYEGAWMIVS